MSRGVPGHTCEDLAPAPHLVARWWTFTDRRRSGRAGPGWRGTRRLHLGGLSAQPAGVWTVRQVRNLVMDLGERIAGRRSLTHDRAPLFTVAVREVFTIEGLRVITARSRTPRMNAICERVIGTLRRELLDRILILSERHLALVLPDHLIHDNGQRPYRSRQQRPPDSATQPLPRFPQRSDACSAGAATRHPADGARAGGACINRIRDALTRSGCSGGEAVHHLWVNDDAHHAADKPLVEELLVLRVAHVRVSFGETSREFEATLIVESD